MLGKGEAEGVERVLLELTNKMSSNITKIGNGTQKITLQILSIERFAERI